MILLLDTTLWSVFKWHSDNFAREKTKRHGYTGVRVCLELRCNGSRERSESSLLETTSSNPGIKSINNLSMI